MSQWVQHKSGQGEKWELDHCVHALDVWNVKSNTWIRLPKSEYIPCDPPEEWEDVTAIAGLAKYTLSVGGCLATGFYRIRKLDGPHNGPCFIVERRKA